MLRKCVFLIMGLCALTVADSWSFYGGPWCAKNMVDIAVGLKNGSLVIYGVNFDYSLVKSTDEGQSWITLLQDVPISDRKVRCVTCDPCNADLVYIGLPRGQGRLFEGIQCSTDGGNTWVERNAGLPASFTPSAIAMRDAQHIVLGMDPLSANDHTIYYWNVTQWSQAIFPNPNYKGFRVADLKWDPRSGYERYIYASSDKVASGGNPHYIGVYQSSNYGQDWTQIGHADPSQPSGYMERPEALSVCCGLNGYIYAGYRPEAVSHTDGGVMRTTDGGLTWTRVLNMENFPVNDVLGDPINPQKVYAAFGCSDYSYEGKGIYRNTNAGELGLWSPFNEDLTDLYTNVLVTFKVNTQDFLFLGTDNSFYVRNLTTPTNWIERVKGMHKPKVIAVEPRIPNFFSFSDKANYASENNGIDWTTRSTVARISENLSAEVHPSLNGEMLKWTKVFLPEIEYDIYHSTDGGFMWYSRYRERYTDLPFIPNFAYSYYPGDPHKVYTFTNQYYGYYRFLLSSSNFGTTWTEHNTPYVEPGYYITSVACDPNYDQEDHIYISGSHKTYESRDGGNTWINRTMINESYEWATIIFKPEGGSDLSYNLLHAWAPLSASAPRYSKTTNFGATWLYTSEIGDHQFGLSFIDPEEPSVVYTAPFNPNTNFSDFYFSVDYCHVWIQDNRGLPPTRIWDLEVDPNSPQYLYAGTDEGVYYWTPPFISKHLVSSSSEATFANNGRKLLHVYGTDEKWVTYESGGVIYAVHSTDAGVTWSRKMEIGKGKYPAIAIRDLPEYPPCVVYLKDNDQDTIYFARYIGENKWSAPAPIVVSQSGINFGPPSFVIGDYNIGHLVFSEHSVCYYVNFNVYDPSNPSTPELIGPGINPCIGFMGDSQYPRLHVVLEHNGVIYYSARISENNWTREIVSTDEYITISNSQHPSLIVEGAVVYVVWDGELNNNRDIFWRHLTYIGEESIWSWIWPVCQTAEPSSYPVLTTGFFCSWVEEVGTDYEIYYARYDPMLWTWRDQTNLSNSPDKNSCYSHLAYKQTEQGTEVYFIWTENSNPPYDIKFTSITIGGGGSSPELLGGLPLYIAKGGEEVPSPFNVRREGYVEYGSAPYQKVDIDNQYIKYQFAGLNPEDDYALTACLYQHGYSNLPLIVRIDNQGVGVVNLPPDTLIMRRHQVPRGLYADGVIKIKVSGNPAISALLVLYRYERKRAGGGPQDKETMPMGALKPELEVYPNPFTTKLDIRYEIPDTRYEITNEHISDISYLTSVSLKIYDATGRLVKDFSSLTFNVERSTVLWDGSDDSGRKLPAGVYFVRLESEGFKQVEKVILLR